MEIRTAEIKDLKYLVNIYNEAIVAGERTADTELFSIALRTEWFNSHTNDKYPIYIAEINGKIAGYLSLSPYRPGRKAVSHTAEVSYYIDFRYHRKGIASELLLHAINQCTTLNINILLAIILESNTGSIKLMEKFNFQKWGYLPGVARFGNKTIGHCYYGLDTGQ